MISIKYRINKDLAYRTPLRRTYEIHETQETQKSQETREEEETRQAYSGS